jgi:hypothetical protein
MREISPSSSGDGPYKQQCAIYARSSTFGQRETPPKWYQASTYTSLSQWSRGSRADLRSIVPPFAALDCEGAKPLFTHQESRVVRSVRCTRTADKVTGVSRLLTLQEEIYSVSLIASINRPFFPHLLLYMLTIDTWLSELCSNS